MKPSWIRTLALAVTAAIGLLYVAAPATAQDKKLTVWWVKGFYKSEDDALYAAIKKYEAKTGVKVELSQYAVQDMIPKSVAALDAGTPPDIAYSDTYDVQTAGKWAFDGKLEDITDVIEPMKDRLRAAPRRDRLPLQRQDQEEGLLRLPAEAADPAHPVSGRTCWTRPASRKTTSRQDWKEYWSFWCDKVQPAIRKATGQRIYGIGQPMGVEFDRLASSRS